jgi:hypothetical protein
MIFQFACAQYVIGYLTKSESGMSQLLKAVNEQAGELSNMDIINQLASVLDKHREVSIQEATYRILSLPNHPLKSNTCQQYTLTLEMAY